MDMIYSVGDLKKLISESSSEFKAKLGDGVESENKKNNDKTYKDIEKETGAKEEKPKHNLPPKLDGNKTTLDNLYDDEPSSDFKKKVHSQAKGYTSKAEEDNGIEKTGEFSDDFYKSAKDAGRKMSKNIKDMKKTGLQAREMPDETFDKNDIYENKKIKTVHFKKTAFLGEEHMLSRVPDEFKLDGNVFKMKDKNENTYLVEWKRDTYKGINEGVVLKHSNKKKINEDLNRIKNLFNYKSSDYFSGINGSQRLSEGNENLSNTLEKARKIIK